MTLMAGILEDLIWCICMTLMTLVLFKILVLLAAEGERLSHQEPRKRNNCSVELDPASFSLSVLELRNNCSKLNDAYNIEKSEKASLLEKLDITAELLEKNVVLENSIASLNTELQLAKEKVKTLEETCQSLIKEKSIIVSEKDALQSQFQVLTENSCVLSDKNVYLENSLTDTNDEVTVLKENSRRLEESLSLIICIEKTGQLNKTETLSSQLDITRQKLEETEINCEELELSNFNLLIVKELLVCSIVDLRNMLSSEKNEKAALIEKLDIMTKLLEKNAVLENSVANLNTELQQVKEKVKTSEETCESLIENNSSLELKYLELFEAYNTSEKLIAHMEQKNGDQLVESKALYAALEKIRMGFFQMSKTLEIDSGIGPECKFEDEIVSYQTRLNQLLENAEDIKQALAATLDENQKNVLEKSVLVTLLQQLCLEATDLDAEKYILSQNLESSELRLLKLLAEIHGLSEINEGLKRRVEEGDRREMMLRNDRKELNLNSLGAQGSFKILQQDNSLVLEEKKSLMEELGALLNERTKMQRAIEDRKGECNNLKEIREKQTEQIIELGGLPEALLNERTKMQRAIEDLKGECNNLKEIKEKQTEQIIELGGLLEALLNERTKMQRAIEDLKGECNNLKAIKEKHTEQIIELLEDNKLKTVENDDLRGSKNTLEAELLELVKKHEIAKTTEATLKFELQRWEIKEHLREKEFEELFRTLQISAVNEAYYHEKFYELHEKLESMMSKVSVADTEAQLQKDRIIALEVENAELKTHFSEYDSAVSSLSEAVTSLENHTIFRDKLSQIHKNKDARSSEIIAEKEMDVIGKMEISGSPKDSQQKGKNMKILERLLFDAQKLANLQKTVQDLKIKVAISEKSKRC